ncbi:MAG: anaerobic ribonucleoside-triphosphate reductase activating protein, partial [Candidatus Methanomethylophilaceae archaeon]
FIRTTLLDWDGYVACTIYLAGCDFRCPYCHNRDLVLHPDTLDEMDLEKIYKYIEDNSDFLDGVVISGGEPTLNKELPFLIKQLRSLGMKIKIDTNGYHPEVLDDIIGAGLVDKVAMDIKAPLTKERYSAVTGQDIDPEKIRKSIGIIMNSGIDYEFRTTVAPILIKPEDIESICREIKGAKCYCIHQFRPKICLDDRLEVLDPYKESVVLGMGETAKRFVRDVKIKGI